MVPSTAFMAPSYNPPAPKQQRPKTTQTLTSTNPLKNWMTRMRTCQGLGAFLLGAMAQRLLELRDF